MEPNNNSQPTPDINPPTPQDAPPIPPSPLPQTNSVTSQAVPYAPASSLGPAAPSVSTIQSESAAQLGPNEAVAGPIPSAPQTVAGSTPSTPPAATGKKFPIKLLLIIGLPILVIAIVAVVIVILINQGGSASDSGGGVAAADTTDTNDNSLLTCTRHNANDGVIGTTPSTQVVTAHFDSSGTQLLEISSVKTSEYEDEATAKNMFQYEESTGYDPILKRLDLEVDPLTSNYELDGNTIVATHSTNSLDDRINNQIFYTLTLYGGSTYQIFTNEATLNRIKEVLADHGYSCTGGSPINSQKAERDAQREQDLNKLSAALQQYKSTAGKIPFISFSIYGSNVASNIANKSTSSDGIFSQVVADVLGQEPKDPDGNYYIFNPQLCEAGAVGDKCRKQIYEGTSMSSNTESPTFFNMAHNIYVTYGATCDGYSTVKAEDIAPHYDRASHVAVSYMREGAAEPICVSF